MTRQRKYLQKTVGFLFVYSLILGGIFLGIITTPTLAEGNEPTNTPVPTATATPTATLVPTEPTGQSGDQLESKVIPQPEVSFDENAAPISSESDQPEPGGLLRSLGGTNLCLIGAIVVGTIAVMVMVVFGVVQRIRAEE